jgi:hypothetical protein
MAMAVMAVVMWMMVVSMVVMTIRSKGSVRIVAVVVRKHIDYL